VLALTFTKILWWVFIIGGGWVVFLIVLLCISALHRRMGRWWTSLVVLVVGAVIAIAVVFPLHHGDGRSTSYNDGWDFVAIGPTGSFIDVFGSKSCTTIFHGEEAAQSFPSPEREKEWVEGCRDARAALRAAELNVTIQVKTPE